MSASGRDRRQVDTWQKADLITPAAEAEMISLPVIYGVHFLIIGNGSVQASVTERPVALPPTTARECAMPDQPTQTREGLLAATVESLVFFHQVSCQMRHATWGSYDAIAEARRLLTWTDQILS
jgi:hypothetical protein